MTPQEQLDRARVFSILRHMAERSGFREPDSFRVVVLILFEKGRVTISMAGWEGSAPTLFEALLDAWRARSAELESSAELERAR